MKLRSKELAGAQADHRILQILIVATVQEDVAARTLDLERGVRIPVAETERALEHEGMFRLRLDEEVGHAGVGKNKFQSEIRFRAARRLGIPGELHITDVAVNTEFSLARLEAQCK